MLVNEKPAHGGGLVPLMVGQDQRPVEDYRYSTSVCAHSITLLGHHKLHSSFPIGGVQ